MINLRKQQEEVTDQHGNKEKGEHSKDVPRIDPNNTDIMLTTRHDEISSESVSNSHENSNPTPPATTENEVQSSKETTCPHFLTGHCSKKRNCVFKHNVATCKLGRNCLNKSKTCFLRHPKVCTKFLNKKCGFTNSRGEWVNYRNCSYLHQIPEQPHLDLPPSLGHTDHHEEPQNNYKETLQSDLSKALLKIEALEKSVCQLKENIKRIEEENLDKKKQLDDQQYPIACLSNHPTNKKVNNETPSLETTEPGMQIKNKEEPDGVDTGDNEVSGPVNSQAFTPGGIAEAERRAGNEKKEPKRIKKHPILNKVVNALFTTRSLSSLGSPPPDQLPDAAPGNGKSKNRTKDAKVSKKDTESVQIISDGLAAHPLKRCDNCRTHPCLDNQVITTNNLVLEIGPFKNGKTYQKSDFKGILGGKNVTGVVQIHQHNRYTRFMHYINGERQTWEVNGQKQEWAPFSSDISTLIYRCKR